ncbi:MAG: hypothetical protein B7Z66_08615 [Chromatiales bacterium 21-64-14]|nr:MAG: hypothetical protein B7Z66_08615 [Chromatiales bacterium 21-64-14]HQU15401.1 flippase [Gammaproteobacteria bacterium]
MRRNILWNVLGVLLPMLAGLAAIPQLLERLGAERFGILSLGWMLVGYIGMLDLGLGRALTRAIAEQIGQDVPVARQFVLARRATQIMVAIGIGWMLLIVALIPWLVGDAIKIPADLHAQARIGFFWLAGCAPFMLYSNSRIALLEGRERFAHVNLVRIPTGVAYFLAPLGVAIYTHDLEWVLFSLLVVRIAASISLAMLVDARERVPTSSSCSQSDLRSLFHFGGWLTVSNVLGPMMTYLDRFYIGAILSVTAVAYYTVPYDAIVRLTSLPVAMMGALFPALTNAHTVSTARLSHIVRTVTNLLLVAWFPGLLVAMLFAQEILAWWVGPEMAWHSFRVWRWLVVGVFINGFAHVPYNLLLSAGRSDLTAKFHFFELPVYVLMLIVGISVSGIEGVAIAWTSRVSLDTVLLFVAAIRLYPIQRRESYRALLFLASGTLLLLAALFFEDHLSEPVALSLFLLGVAGSVVAGAAFQIRKIA